MKPWRPLCSEHHPRICILAHHILECFNQGYRILGNRILKTMSLETIVLSTQPQRMYMLAHHILERRIQGNRILVNRILGNHETVETVVLRTSPKNLHPGSPHFRML